VLVGDSPEAPGSDRAARKLRLIIGYDGSGFLGSQTQPNGRSVQQELERALERYGGQPVTTEFAGRTDRGVHAVGQVVDTIDLRPAEPGDTVRRALNHLLPGDVAVASVTRVDAGCHARYDAAWREYRYRIWIGDRQPLAGHLSWSRRTPLDLAAMSAAARSLVGTHDLASFTGGGEGVPWSSRATAPRGTTRIVSLCGVRPVAAWWGVMPGDGQGIEIRIVADGFLPQLVRTVVGGLVTIGSGRKPVEWFQELLDRRDRRIGPAVAPAHGLVLWRVGYGNDVPDPDPDGTSIVRTVPPHMQHG
jgi:tRNA pseudouridine38-40 synthase